MPGLTPGIHASLFVDGRVKRGHDDWNNELNSFGLYQVSESVTHRGIPEAAQI